MFGIKTQIKKQINYLFFSKMLNSLFQEKGYPKWLIKLYLRSIYSQLQNRHTEYNMGWLYNLPHEFAVETYKYFLSQNPNHIGNASIKNTEVEGTRVLERLAIQKMIDLYHAKADEFEGYVTSGATESNLYSMWAGRKYLEQYLKTDKMCVIKTDLTHYSIRKSADITNIPEFITPLDKAEWGMSPKGVEETLHSLYAKKYRGFLIPITMGYTATGTSDNLQSLVSTIYKIRRKYKDIHVFMWIDASLNGLIEPFINNQFTPFASPLVQTIAVDFHKLGLIPYSAGIVLYRKSLRKLIEKPVDYFPDTDNTVLGSRPGSAAVSIWAMTSYFGKQGYTYMINKQLRLKRTFLAQLHAMAPQTQIITSPNSLSCGIIFYSLPHQQLAQHICDKYGLYPISKEYKFYPAKVNKKTVYKFFFLPDITKIILDDFLHNFSLEHVKAK